MIEIILSFSLILICGIALGYGFSNIQDMKFIDELMTNNERAMKIIFGLVNELTEKNELLEKYEYELTTVDGLYAADNT